VFNAAGVASERVEFVDQQPRDAYLRTYHRIDIALDTFPYNGHTTSLDAMWMGLAVVTLTGRFAVSRAGLCQLSNIGLERLAAQSEDQFVQIATDLARNPEDLAELRKSLRGRMERSPLMDSAGFARGVEAAIDEMWRKWCLSSN
jgi:predicted O-linked N-acetylglucosamine transferase (SPINDLY family)